MGKIVIYGAGKIGRGYLGQLMTLSDAAFTFIDIDAPLVEKLNASQSYNIHITADDRFEPFTVSGYDALNADDPSADSAFANAAAVFTAVGVSNLPALAVQLARGIIARERHNSEPLNIFLCENKIGASELLRELIAGQLTDSVMSYFRLKIGLVGVAVGRTVPVAPKELTDEQPLALYSDGVLPLPYDRGAVIGELPKVKYLKPVEPFELYIRRKLLIHNMCHALTAYLGSCGGYTYIWQARADGVIESFERGALAESAAALAAEYGVEAAELIEYGNQVLEGFKDKLLGDTAVRVGRDPIRKLGAGDRLSGALSLCRKHGVEPKHISAGIAAGLLFCPQGDSAAQELSRFASDNGVDAALRRYAGITDAETVSRIENYYRLIKSGGLSALKQ